jgi:hypothetical protein
MQRTTSPFNAIQPVAILLALIVFNVPKSFAADGPTLDSDPHLVAWFKFDDAAGKAAADSSAKPHNGSLEGSFSFDTHSAAGRIGKAIRLDGNNQFITLAGYKGITGPSPRSVAAWIKTTSASGEIVSWGTSDAGKMFNVCFIRNRVGISPRGGYLYMKAATNDDQWRHVAVVVREASPPNLHDDVKLYKDGQPAEIDDIGLLDLWPLETGDKQDVRIGNRYKGLIDDLRIYDRPLADEEVAALYKLQSDRPLVKP